MPTRLKPDGELELVLAEGYDGQLVRGEGKKLIEAVYSRERTTGEAGAGIGLVGLALKCAADAAQLAGIRGMLAVDAVGDQDVPAA